MSSFDELRGSARAQEIERTRRFVAETLALRPQIEFPAVPVIYAGCEVSPHVIDHAFTAARIARHRAGATVAEWPWLAAIESAMPAALAYERARLKTDEPVAMSDADAARRSAEDALADMPRGVRLIAPLVLGADHAE